VTRLLEDGYGVLNLDRIPFDCTHASYRYVEVDLADHKALDTVLAGLPVVDALVLNAVHSADTDFLQQSMDDIQRAFEVNLIAHLRLVQWAAHRYEGTAGRVVWISSTRARMSEPNGISYAASKGAIESVTHALAATLAHRFTVNAIAPGWIHHGSDEPDDIARAVLFLIDEAAQFINGETITIDGGVTKTMIYPE
jgi:NAD(P)-dependent dehydrogenase (short-subunit alcohol dehydrogenase family)